MEEARGQNKFAHLRDQLIVVSIAIHSTPSLTIQPNLGLRPINRLVGSLLKLLKPNRPPRPTPKTSRPASKPAPKIAQKSPRNRIASKTSTVPGSAVNAVRTSEKLKKSHAGTLLLLHRLLRVEYALSTSSGKPFPDMSTSASSSKRVLSPITDFPAYLSHVTTTLDRVTTHAADLPGKSDLAFHRTLDRKLAKDIDDASVRVLGLAERILRLVHEPHTGGQGKLRRRMEDEDDVQDGYRRGVVEVVDSLLEDAVSIASRL